MNFKDWFLSAFDTATKGGASARKLSAFWVVVLITFLHLIYLRSERKSAGDFELLPSILIVDYVFIALCLGMVTVEQLIMLYLKFKNGGDKPPENIVPENAEPK